MGRKKLYCPDTFPLLAEKYARDGLIDTQICKKLGIAKTAYYEYQKDYPKFAESIRRGKRPVDIEVENALLKNAMGYDFEEKHTEMDVDSKGVPTIKSIKVVKKHYRGDERAQEFWLKNRKPKEWKARHDIVQHQPLPEERLPKELQDLPDVIVEQIAEHYQKIADES